MTTFGESHGVGLGIVIEGLPAGLPVRMDLLEKQLQRRRPGSGVHVSQRQEDDRPEILSGVHEGKTLGTPLAVLVRNEDARSKDYSEIKDKPRAGHADDVWREKFGHSDPRGGGRSSGRETLCRVIGGSFARMLLESVSPETRVFSYASRIGPIGITEGERSGVVKADVDSFVARCPSVRQDEIELLLTKAREQGDSWGGSVETLIHGAGKGWGQPVFHKLKADLASALMGLGATSGFEVGAGIEAASAKGTEFHSDPGSSRYGGIRGGLSTGEDILLRLHFKPTSSILDVAKKGRHDPCIVPRAVPVVEAMVWWVLADHWLWSRTDRLF